MSKKRLWLPLGRKPKPNPISERDHLKNRLYEARTLVPDADTMEISHLRDIVVAQEERMKNWERAQQLKSLVPQPKPDVAQIRGALSELIRWRRRKLYEMGRIPKEWIIE